MDSSTISILPPLSSVLTTDTRSRCGRVLIAGRPNVGKSTLLNRILGDKLSITSRRPNTTTDLILGVKTQDNIQTIYCDTPGLSSLNKGSGLSRKTHSLVADQAVDICVMVLEAPLFRAEDNKVLEIIRRYHDKPMLLVVNKIDKLHRREQLLPLLEDLHKKTNCDELIPMSAIAPNATLDIAALEQRIAHYLPYRVHCFDADYLTDRDTLFLVTERIREKLMRQLGAELPYQVKVELEDYTEKKDRILISACLQTAKRAHKKILIGKDGSRIKQIGEAARLDLESMLKKPVLLRLWVGLLSTQNQILNHNRL